MRGAVVDGARSAAAPRARHRPAARRAAGPPPPAPPPAAPAPPRRRHRRRHRPHRPRTAAPDRPAPPPRPATAPAPVEMDVTVRVLLPSELIELLDRRARPGARRDQDDHRRDADEDAGHRQQRAQLVRQHPADGEPRALPDVHGRHASAPGAAARGGGPSGPATRTSERSVPSRIRSTRLACCGDLLLVGDHDDRPAGGVEVVEQVQHVVGAGAVQRAGRLVGEQQHRVRDDRPRDRHPLLLAARELRRAVGRPGRPARPAPARPAPAAAARRAGRPA